MAIVLPAGLSLNSTTGVLSGTPTAVSTGLSFTVQGSFKGFPGQQPFTTVVDNSPVLAEWDPSTRRSASCIAVSGGNAWPVGCGGSQASAAETVSKASGKRYYEVRLSGAGMSFCQAGVMPAQHAGTNAAVVGVPSGEVAYSTDG